MAEISQQAAAGANSILRLGADAQDMPDDEHLSVCEALDRLLHKGVVLRGEVAIAVAGIDLIYVGLQVLLASTETARSFIQRDRTPITDKSVVFGQSEQTGQTEQSNGGVLAKAEIMTESGPVDGLGRSDLSRRLL